MPKHAVVLLSGGVDSATTLATAQAQGFECHALSFSYGLALFGRVGSSVGLLLTIGIFLVQVPLSVWWLGRFRFGPIEWAWRSLTYWQRQPMRLTAPATGAALGT